MTSRIINQRTGVEVEICATYEDAAKRRSELRESLDPTQPCPYAIRTDDELPLDPTPVEIDRRLVPVDGWPDYQSEPREELP